MTPLRWRERQQEAAVQERLDAMVAPSVEDAADLANNVSL